MGRRQFWAWIEQANREQNPEPSKASTWRGTEHDAGWQEMRAKRDRWRGR